MRQLRKFLPPLLIALVMSLLSCSTHDGSETVPQSPVENPVPLVQDPIETEQPSELAVAEEPSLPTVTHQSRPEATGYNSADDAPAFGITFGSCTYFNKEFADFYRDLDDSDLPVAATILNGDLAALPAALHANPDERPFFVTPLIMASTLGCTEIMQAIIDLGSDANEATKYDTPLLQAIASGNILAVQLLLEHGADPDLPEEYLGIAPLSAAAYSNQADTITMLLAAGADIHATANKGGESAIAAAGYTDSAAAAAVLIDAGIQFTAADLEVAIWHKSTDFFRFLVESGAIQQIPGANQRILATMARMAGATGIEELLEPES